MIIIRIQAGLGNQLFQYASTRALSIHLKTNLKVDTSFYNDRQNKNAYRLDKFNLPITVADRTECNRLKNPDNIPLFFRLLKRMGIKFSAYYKKTHIFEKDVLRLLKSNHKPTNDYYVEGWLANEIYFKNYRDILLNEICSDQVLSNKNLSIQEKIKNSNSVAVHIRRGDFLTNTYFKLLPKEYYTKAISKALRSIEAPVFYFFSNDPHWVKTEFSDIPNARFIEENSVADTDYSTIGDITDLMLMRTCKHQIIANSTFSWWGAWLNENPYKQVYYPAVYFNNAKAQKQYEKNSFIPANWIKIHF